MRSTYVGLHVKSIEIVDSLVKALLYELARVSLSLRNLPTVMQTFDIDKLLLLLQFTAFIDSFFIL